MNLAAEHGFETIAFPLIGAGSGGFDQGWAQRVMLGNSQTLERPVEVRVVVFSRR